MTGKQSPIIVQPDLSGLGHAADILHHGGLVAVPTETVYGLAARADQDAAVAAIYRAKGRPDFNPLIVHVADRTMAERLAHFDDRSRQLADAFWPGPLTMVLPLKEGSGLAPAVTAGLPTVALRMPAHPAMQALLEMLGLPLAAPSANRSGAVSPTEPSHVVQSLDSAIDAVLDGGPCAMGLESTIVALRPNGTWHLLRHGPIEEAKITALIGPATAVADHRIEAPGQLSSHYSPGKPVRLNAESPATDEFMIGFAGLPGHCNLSPQGDLADAAARLYACLHAAAADARPRIAVAPIPADGIGAAINDRLRRASA